MLCFSRLMLFGVEPDAEPEEEPSREREREREAEEEEEEEELELLDRLFDKCKAGERGSWFYLQSSSSLSFSDILFS